MGGFILLLLIVIVVVFVVPAVALAKASQALRAWSTVRPTSWPYDSSSV